MKKRIKKLRQELEMTQEEFGEVLGITKSGVSAIESGKRNVTDRHIMLLEANPEIPVNVEWIETGKGPMLIPEEEQAETDAILTEEQAEQLSDFKGKFLTMVANMTDEEWLVVEKLCSQLK